MAEFILNQFSVFQKVSLPFGEIVNIKYRTDLNQEYTILLQSIGKQQKSKEFDEYNYKLKQIESLSLSYNITPSVQKNGKKYEEGEEEELFKSLYFFDKGTFNNSLVNHKPENDKIFIQDLALAIKELNENNIVQGCINEHHIYYDLKENKYKLAFPFTYLLLKEKESENYNYIVTNKSDAKFDIYAIYPLLLYNDISIDSNIWALAYFIIQYFNEGSPVFNYNNYDDFSQNFRLGSLQYDDSKVPENYKNFIRLAFNINEIKNISIDDFIANINLNSIGTIGSLNYHLSKNKLLINTNSHENVVLKVNYLPEDFQVAKRIKIIVNSKDITKAKLIEILPEPKIEIILKKSSLQFDPELKKIIGKICFKVTHSIIKLSDIKITLNISGSTIENGIEIKKEILRNKLSGSEIENIIEFHISEVDKLLKIVNEPITINLTLSSNELKKQINSQFQLIIRNPSYVKLSGNLEELSVLRGSDKIVELELQNIGGEEAEIIQIISTDYSEYIKLVSEIKTIQPGQIIPISIKLDATNNIVKSHRSDFIVRYKNIGTNGEEIKLSKKFTYNLNIDLLEYIDTVAIDFGTTNSCSAYYDTVFHNIKTVEFQEIDDEPESIPSVISYEEINTDYKIGKEAKRDLMALKHNAFYSIKSFLSSNKTVHLIKENGDPQSKTYDELIQDYLYSLLKEVINIHKNNFKTFIFTHPTDISNEKLKKFKDIIKYALKRIDQNKKYEIKLLDEASASALNHLYEENEDKKVFVFDFGGGTTDIVYAEYKNIKKEAEIGIEEIRKFIIRGAKGILFGGDNINELIINLLRQKIYEWDKKIIISISFRNDKEIPPRWDNHKKEIARSNFNIMWEFSEKVKRKLYDGITLSEIKNENLVFSKAGQLESPQSWIFEEKEQYYLKELFDKKDRFTDLLDSIKEILEEVLEKNITEALDIVPLAERRENINIILTGKSSQIPIVKELFKKMISNTNMSIKELHHSPELKSAVAKGAIHIINSEIDTPTDVLLRDVFIYNQKIIPQGKIKIKNNIELTELLSENEYLDYAVFQKSFTPKNQDIMLKIIRSGKTEKICEMKLDNLEEITVLVHVDVDDDIKWAVFNKYQNIIAEG